MYKKRTKFSLALALIILIQLLSFPGINLKSVYAFSNEQEFLDWLESIDQRIYDSRGRKANFEVYNKYDNIVVYGSPFGNSLSDWKAVSNGRWIHNGQKGEFRYLGYNIHGSVVTNPYFPRDEGGTSLPPSQWNFLKVTDAIDSWDIYSDDIQNFMLNQPVYNMTPDQTIKIKDIGGKEYAKVLTTPTWRSGFSVYTEYTAPDATGKRYATFHGPSLTEAGGSVFLSCSIDTDRDTYTISSDRTYVDVEVTASAAATFSGPFVGPEQVKEIDVSFEDSSNSKAKTDKVSLHTTKRLDRGSYAPGTHQVTLKADASLQSNLPGDDTVIRESAQKTITLIVEQIESPYITADAYTDPSHAKFKNKDINVKVNVDAILNNISNEADILSCLIRATDSEGTQKSETFYSCAQASASFSFTIPASRVTGDSYTEKYSVYIRYLTRNGTYEATIFCNTVVSKDDTDPPQLPPGLIPPIANIACNSTVRLGEDLWVSAGGSRDPDGRIVEYIWQTPGSIGSLSGVSGSIRYDSLGDKHINLQVIDNDGLADYASKAVTVIESKPYVRMQIEGSLKVNRKITLLDVTDNPDDYDVLERKWTVTAVSGTGADQGAIYLDNPDNLSSLNILIKKAGEYDVALRHKNTAGYEDTITKRIVIAEDAAPIANFNTVNNIIRDSSGTAYIILNDQSYSPDGDVITQRIWTVKYDSDNDGSFDDETAVVIDNGNNKTVRYETESVGKYLFELEVREAFGQPTISRFISPGDYRKGNTSGKPFSEKQVEIINVAPVSGFSSTQKKQVDIKFIVDAGLKNSLNNQLALFKAELLENNIDCSIDVTTIESKGTPDSVYKSYSVPALNKSGINFYMAKRAGTIYYNSSTETSWIVVADIEGTYLKEFDLGVDLSSWLPSYTKALPDIKHNRIFLYYSYTYDYQVKAMVIDLNTGFVSDSFIIDSDYFISPYDAWVDSDGNLQFTIGLRGSSSSYYYMRKVVMEGATGNIIYDEQYDKQLRRYHHSGVYTYTGDEGLFAGISYKKNRAYFIIARDEEDGEIDGFNRNDTIYVREYALTGSLRSETMAHRTYYTQAEHIDLGSAPILYEKYIYFLIQDLIVRERDNGGYTHYHYTYLCRYDIDSKNTHDVMVSDNYSVGRLTLHNDDNLLSMEDFYNSSWVERRRFCSLDLKFLDTTPSTYRSYIDDYDSCTFTYGRFIDDYLYYSYREYFGGEYKYYYGVRKNRSPVTVEGSIKYPDNKWGYKRSGSTIYKYLQPKAAILNEELSNCSFRDSSDKYIVFMLNEKLYYPEGAYHDREIPALNDSNVLFFTADDIPDILEYRDIFMSSFEGEQFDLSTDMQDNVNKVKEIILSNLVSSIVGEHYILAGSRVDINEFYSDYENDPLYSSRWTYIHNPYYFDNPLGVIPDNGEVRTEPYTMFDLTGEYRITKSDVDNPLDDDRFSDYRKSSIPCELLFYVVRKPIADFLINLHEEEIQSTTTLEDFETADLRFSITGNGLPWARTTEVRRSGSYSFGSNTMTYHSEGSIAKLTVYVPAYSAATIEFDYLVSSEEGYDWFIVTIDNKEVLKESGDVSWTHFSAELTSGSNKIEFKYKKDSSTNRGRDRAFIDNLKVTINQAPSELNVSCISTSYDLDHTSKANKGIALEEWKYRMVGDSTWSDGKPTSFEKGKNFEVSLRVLDIDGFWSDNCVRTIDLSQDNRPPIAFFVFTPNPLPINETATVSDLSTDPDGDIITQRQWELIDASSKIIYTGSSPVTNFSSYGTGIYEMRLRVYDGSLWSEWHSVRIEVIDDVIPPVLTLNPESRPYENTDVTVRITASDSSGIRNVRYKWTNSMDKPETGYTTVTSDSFNCSISETGVWYLHVIATDDSANRNESYKMGGPYEIDKIPPALDCLDIISYKYTDGNTYWYSQGDTAVVRISSLERHSGMHRTYLGLATPDGCEAYHDWNAGSSHIEEYDTSPYLDVVSASETFTENGLHEVQFSVECRRSSKSLLSYCLQDNCGNNTGWISVGKYIGIDADPPELIVTPESREWDTSNVTARVTVLESGSGIRSIKYSWSESPERPAGGWSQTGDMDFDVSISQTGRWYLHVEAVDNVGNSAHRAFGCYEIDKVPPQGSHTLSTTGWTNEDVLITVSGIDLHSGMNRIGKADGTWTIGQTALYSAPQNGVYYFILEDNVGLRTEYPVPITNIDKINPALLNVEFSGYDRIEENIVYVRTSENILNVKIKGSDDLSQIARTYLRFSNDDDTAAYHDWNLSSGHLEEYDTSRYSKITGCTEVFRDETISECTFTIQPLMDNIARVYVCLTDNAGNSTGWIDTGYDVVFFTNRPPSVGIVKIQPEPVYEGDYVTVVFMADDPNRDTLCITIELADKNGNKLFRDSYTINPVTGIYQEESYTIEQIIPIGEGYRLSVLAEDPYGETALDSIVFDVSKPEATEVTIEGYWNHWRGQVDLFGRQMSFEPHRFLSLESVKINIFTTGYADRVVIRFSPELESMRYTDRFGRTYDYVDDFTGMEKYVNFPQDSTFMLDPAQKEGHVYWEYLLPLAPSTVDWNDHRLRPPYSMSVYVYKGAEYSVHVIDDIDITGNVYDLVYIQPLN